MPATRPTTSRFATALAACALAALVAALALTVTRGGTLGDSHPLHGWYLADLGLFAVAMALLRRVPERHIAGLVLAGSVAVAAAGLLAPPRTSDDAYRYVWDGRVQAAGISPYRYTPADPALAGLRDPALFPPGSCKAWNEHRAAKGVCTHINRPGVHTIYPPVAELWFLGLHTAGGTVRTVQVGGALLAIATTGVLLLVDRRDWRAGLWGWFPGIAIWSVNDAHVDTLGVLLLVIALALVARRRTVTAGIALGAAIATKLLPGLALPGAMSGVLARRPRLADLALPGAALAAFALAYLPYVRASGIGVIGYLPGYLREEGYEDNGTTVRFGLLRLLLPAEAAPYAAALVLAVVVLYVLRRGDPARPWSGALLVTGTALLLVAPAYPWYGLLVVALVALDGRWEWLAVPAAGQALYLFEGDAQQPAYAAALAVVVTGAVVRRGRVNTD
ncbi:glycosyltransferase 87 family protein [Kitasatospora sp. HPMI-4]|uniref:glycosyltransferase 87 family protein n=1 Tax=Kitasatospora sp. HPMI-4 TaxID=3448443 RepID=UPI003F1B2B64